MTCSSPRALSSPVQHLPADSPAFTGPCALEATAAPAPQAGELQYLFTTTLRMLRAAVSQKSSVRDGVTTAGGQDPERGRAMGSAKIGGREGAKLGAKEAGFSGRWLNLQNGPLGAGGEPLTPGAAGSPPHPPDSPLPPQGQLGASPSPRQPSASQSQLGAPHITLDSPLPLRGQLGAAPPRSNMPPSAGQHSPMKACFSSSAPSR